MIRLIVGLGNPGSEYEHTRHNVGFRWLERAARQLGATLKSERSYHGLVARVNRGGDALYLLQPQTYMNLSGKSVAALARFYKIAPPQMLVVHDEIDLAAGQVKLKLGGGVAGHNGLKDIQAQLGSADFWRLRIGVGHPGNRDEVADWVLCKPSPEQRQAIESCVERSLDALDLLIDGPMERAMMKIHAKPKAAPAAPAP
ncbi:MAG: Peptidyl-tRNA hydrolase [Burkholderiaceae bacterium]|nr:Peptidyl-tRNA hydrolase [Burkholderiaceae bacterium]